MAKRSKVVRQAQREVLVARHAEKRAELRKISIDQTKSLEERMEARAAMADLPRDSAAVRLKNRCKITGRPHGYMRRFGISRVALRRMAHAGLLPGVTKSSW